MNQRSMVGTRDFTGYEIGTLTIDAMVSRHPSPKYAATCRRCGAKLTIAQRDLAIGSAVCRASGCGREAVREACEDTPRRFAQREARLKQDRLDALARDVQAKATKIARLVRERLQTGIDLDFPYASDNLQDVTMSAAEADGFNALHAARFVAANPWYFPTDKNLEVMAGYLQRHGIVLASATQLELAARRLDEFGLLERRPVVEPTPEPPYVNLSIERPAEPTPKRREPEMGYDLKTGEQRLYTPYEIDRLSADEYRRVFRLCGDKMPTFPTHAAF